MLSLSSIITSFACAYICTIVLVTYVDHNRAVIIRSLIGVHSHKHFDFTIPVVVVRSTGKDDGFSSLGSDLPWHVHLHTLTIVYPSDSVPFPSLPRQFIWIIHCSDVPYVPIFLVTLGLASEEWGLALRSNWYLQVRVFFQGFQSLRRLQFHC